MIHLILLLAAWLIVIAGTFYVGLMLLGLVLALLTWPIRAVIEYAKRRSS